MKFRLRSVRQEFEAHLHPAQAGSEIRGKSEWKQYEDGTYRFKVSVRNLSLPDNSRLELFLDETRVMHLTVQGSKAKADLEGPTQIGIPKVQAGQVLRVKFGESVLAEGVYEEE